MILKYDYGINSQNLFYLKSKYIEHSNSLNFYPPQVLVEKALKIKKFEKMSFLPPGCNYFFLSKSNNITKL